MGRTGTLGAALLGALVFWTSCGAVKEERQECPCVLSVQLKDLPAYPVTLYLNGSVAGEALRDTTLQLWAEKGGQVTLTAVSGAIPAGGDAVTIPYGEQAPALYAYRAQADCTGECAQAVVRMYKHFCTLTLRFKGVLEGKGPEVAIKGDNAPSGPFPSGNSISAAVRGGVNGFSLDEGRPLEGAFSCRMDSSLSCRVPRQRPGDPLWLDLVLPDSLVRSFPLGALLEEAGYDWTAPDLADQALEADLSMYTIRFQKGDWSSVEALSIVI